MFYFKLLKQIVIFLMQANTQAMMLYTVYVSFVYLRIIVYTLCYFFMTLSECQEYIFEILFSLLFFPFAMMFCL